MREVLFRGKRKDNGKWVEGFLTIDPTICDYVIDIVGVTSILIYPETVGQYTGLTDKNGKKIFEGDIHEIQDTFFVVKYGEYKDGDFDEKRYGWYFECVDDEWCNGFYGNEKDYANIIGNIHDNPELLKERF